MMVPPPDRALGGGPVGGETGRGSAAMGLGGISNFDYAVLLCGKMEETRAFYRDVMKFPVETDRGNWVSFRVGPRC